MGRNRSFSGKYWRSIPGFKRYSFNVNTLAVYNTISGKRILYQTDSKGKTFVKLKGNDGKWKEYSLKSMTSILKQYYSKDGIDYSMDKGYTKNGSIVLSI